MRNISLEMRNLGLEMSNLGLEMSKQGKSAEMDSMLKDSSKLHLIPSKYQRCIGKHFYLNILFNLYFFELRFLPKFYK